MAAPTPERVAAYLGATDDATLRLAAEHLPIVTAYVRAYVRGHGFEPFTGEPTDDLAAVIVSACARLTANPSQARQMSAPGGFGESPAILVGFTLPEQAVLHLYRRRTA